MRKMALVFFLALVISSLGFTAQSPYPPPPEVGSEYGFSHLDEETMKALLKQGSLIIVRQKDDLSLINVTAAQLVEAPVELVFNTIIDFERYPDFMPQTTEYKILEKPGENLILVEQSIGIKIWQLPSVDLTYQLAQEITPHAKVRFWHVSGPLEGTYGGWDLVATGDKTMIFYTLYSNLTALRWGLGGIFKSQPDFMTGVNVTTAMMVAKAIKEECEKRAVKKD